MADLSINGIGIEAAKSLVTSSQSATSVAAPEGKDFKTFLMDSLDKVNKLQNEANQGVERLMTGETDNVAEVMSVSRKAGVAFDLLMEIRNKLMDAYGELKQMRV